MKKIAVITGASGGLGKEFVRQIINEVDEVWAIGRNVAKLEAMKSEFAGAGRFGPSTDFSTEELAAGITTHCTAMAAICNICLPFMKRGDHLVNVASQSAFSPLPYINLYAATKAFVYSYSRALREELRDTGIIVTTICPGWIKTALLPDTLNGHMVKFPFLVTADKVAAKAIRDARRGKPLSIYRFAVRYVSWLQRHYPTGFSVRVWANSVRKYLK